MSSRGRDRMTPFSSSLEDTVGIIGWFGGVQTSKMKGPSHEMARFIALSRSAKCSTLSPSIPKAVAILIESGKVRPESGPAPIYLDSN
jgi:hypothetical protein